MDLNLVAPINPLGYGVVGFNVLKHLVAAGHSVSLFPIGRPEFDAPDAPKLIADAQNKSQLFNATAPSIRLWHQFELDMFPGKGKRIGWPIFELNKFNEREKHHLSSLDAILVCSKWAADVIKQNGINVPTFVVPLGVDNNVFKADPDEIARRPYWSKGTTVFINVGKWEKRKGHEELIAAFCAAFTTRDDVELWMINENPFIGPENDVWKKKYVNSPMGAHVRFFGRLENQAQMSKLFNHADCGVFPSHAEGWNLEALELMACGAHVILTDYSGHTEYATKENSTLIPVNGLEPAVDGRWFDGHGDWCTFDIMELVSAMRAVHERKQSGLLGLNTAGMETAEKFSWENTIKAIEAATSV